MTKKNPTQMELYNHHAVTSAPDLGSLMCVFNYTVPLTYSTSLWYG